MVSRVQSLRSSTKGARPPAGRAVGEIYLNFPDKQIGVVGPAGNIDLVPVRFFSETTDYAIGDLVARGGDIYRAAVVVAAGPWNGTQWSDIVHEADRHHGVTLFDASKSYLQNELVTTNGEIYRAKSAIPAGAFNAALWTKISPTPQAAMGVSPFSATAAYAQDDLVSHQGKIYRAKAPIAAGVWNSTKWEDINPLTGIQPFDATKAYAKDDLVSSAGKIYHAKHAVTAGAWKPADWQDININVTDVVTAFDAAKAYAQNDLVATGGKIYSAKAAVPAGAFNAAQWNEIGATTPHPITVFDATKAYALNDIVANAGKLYSAKAAIAAGAWDATKWNDINGNAYLNVAQNWTATQSYPLVALNFGATVAWALASSQKASLPLTGNAILSATGSKAGSSYWLFVTGTGTATLSFDTAASFDFGTAGAPTLSGGGKTDILMFECRTDGGKLMFLGCSKGFA
jgi:hypothetical protein